MSTSQSESNELILKDIPESFETERLLIRAPLPGDGAAVNAAIHETLESLQPWMPWANPAPTPDQTEAHLRKSRIAYLQRTDLGLLLFNKATGEYVGGSGLHRLDWHARMAEIGYWCRKRFQGQGYITEAVRGIAKFGFDHFGARRIFILIAVTNDKSIRVTERAGFVFEALLRNRLPLPSGESVDARIYSLIPQERERLAE